METSEVNPITYEDTTETVPGYISSRLMAAYDFPAEHTLHVNWVERGQGRVRWRYVLTRAGEVIFEGADVRLRSVTSYAEAAKTILGFLTIRPDDTDADYFEWFTPSQVAWRDEYAEHLAMWAYR